MLVIMSGETCLTCTQEQSKQAVVLQQNIPIYFLVSNKRFSVVLQTHEKKP